MRRTVVRTMARVGCAVVAATLVQVVAHGHDRNAPLAVSRVVLVAARDVDRFVVEETYRAELTHTGRAGSGDFAAITAHVAGFAGFAFPGQLIRVVDGDLEFGSVRAGGTVESVDTFTIQRRERAPLRPSLLRWDISARPDLVLSDAWAGQWDMTIARRNPVTNTIASIDHVSDAIGGDEPVGFSLFPPALRCSWQGSDSFLHAECRARVREAACAIEAEAHIAVQRHDTSIEGSGRWDASVFGDCGMNSGSGGEVLQISGIRVGDAIETEPLSPGVLTKFAFEPALFSATPTSGDAGREPPRSDRDCFHGRWRRFFDLDLRGLRHCIAFVARHHDRDDFPGERRR